MSPAEQRVCSGWQSASGSCVLRQPDVVEAILASRGDVDLIATAFLRPRHPDLFCKVNRRQGSLQYEALERARRGKGQLKTRSHFPGVSEMCTDKAYDIVQARGI